jgi:type VI secretion system protein ImpG
LASLSCDQLRFFLNLPFGSACDWYRVLSQNVISVAIRNPQRIPLPNAAWQSPGFTDIQPVHDGRIVHSAYHLIRDYLTFAEKFLYFELSLADWKPRQGTQFEIELVLRTANTLLRALEPRDLPMYVTPVVNLFAALADPIVLDQKQQQVELIARQSMLSSRNRPFPVVDVVRAQSVARGREAHREFYPIWSLNSNQSDRAGYSCTMEREPGGDGIRTRFSFKVPEAEPILEREVLRVAVTCSNGEVAAQLQAGDIRVPTSETPELVTFQNLCPATRPCQPSVNEDNLWHLVSDMATHHASLAHAESLRSYLLDHIPVGQDDDVRQIANRRRIEAIEQVKVTAEDRMYGRSYIRGQAFAVYIRNENFISDGDKYVFGCLLDSVIASHAIINSFTRLTLIDTRSGEQMQWPSRLGQKPLI